MKIEGRCQISGDNIDTDVIIPTMYCISTDPIQLGKHCFANSEDNFPELAKKFPIIVAGNNFGCGSSREVAPLALKGAGVTCVIAKSFARIFYRNAINVGLPVFVHPHIVEDARAEHRLSIDFTAGRCINESIQRQYEVPKFGGPMDEIFRLGGLVEYFRHSVASGGLI